MFKGTRNFMSGFAVGVGVGLVAREAWPYVSEAVRPVAKALTKASVQIAKKAEKNYWIMRETIEDLMAESHSEIDEAGIEEDLEKEAAMPPEIEQAGVIEMTPKEDQDEKHGRASVH